MVFSRIALPSDFYIVPAEDLQVEETCKVVIPLTESLRLSEVSVFCPSNPFTGEATVVSNLPLEIEAYDPVMKVWGNALIWHKEKVVITQSFSLGDRKDYMWRVVSWLAQKLDGQIFRENGELYHRVHGTLVRDESGNMVDETRVYRHHTLLSSDEDDSSSEVTA